MTDTLQGNLSDSSDNESVHIHLASPEMIRGSAREGKGWSYGKVTSPKAFTGGTMNPDPDGLFSERIFGRNSQYNQPRRERMGHIELEAPVSHVWYLKGRPSPMALLLDMKPGDLEKVIYYNGYVVLSAEHPKYKQILSESEYQEYQERKEKEEDQFKAGIGAEAVEELLQKVDLNKERLKLEGIVDETCGDERERAIRRLEVVEAFIESGNQPSWMILDAIPVIPPDLRPMIRLDGGTFAASDLNKLYARVIRHNNRVKSLMENDAPEIILNNEKRMLQEAVDALFDNGRHGELVTDKPGRSGRPLKSLSDSLKGKNGRFRQNLLGKRVDYSGRSVIVVDPTLKIYQCGVPKDMALELFKPFVEKELMDRGVAADVREAKRLVDKNDPAKWLDCNVDVWELLEDVIRDHPVMLNRQPSLHRLSVQAFEPVLVEGKAIHFHPLACTPFNADFDGDQMAIYVPLSEEAQAECRFLMLSPNNVLKPSDGKPVNIPTQDMVLGIYYLTQIRDGEPGEGSSYVSVNEATLAYENQYITLHSKILIRVSKKDSEGNVHTGVIGNYQNGDRAVSLGRMLFNEVIPQDLGYVDRTKPENIILPEINFPVGKKELKDILERIIEVHGTFRCAEILDRIKELGFKWSTIAGLTFSAADISTPDKKTELVEEGWEETEKANKDFRRKLISEQERHEKVVRIWDEVDSELKNPGNDEQMKKEKSFLESMNPDNELYMMIHSGARGNEDQLSQIAVMHGMVQDTKGRTIEQPITSSFREGLNAVEYFTSAHGSRKGQVDKSLRTADAGYLTRRMVDASQELIIRETDCAKGSEDIPGMNVKAFIRELGDVQKSESGDQSECSGSSVSEGEGKSGGISEVTNGPEVVESLKDRIQGRVACEDIRDVDGNVIVKRNHMITFHAARMILERGLDHNGKPVDPLKSEIRIRTVMSCRSRFGVCAKCYGMNMATGEIVQAGEPVGIIAAQSVGEPGTQMTLKNFHSGGVAGTADITQGLPRVEELFEARKPENPAVLAKISGRVRVTVRREGDVENTKKIVVINGEDGNTRQSIPYGKNLKVSDGCMVEAGDPLTDGSVDLRKYLELKGVEAVQNYLLGEIQKAYRDQDVELSDKHIEVIISQMMKKTRIEEPGDSGFTPGVLVDYLDFDEKNEELVRDGKEPAKGTRILQGITRVAKGTDSFLAAASFQETSNVLMNAAIRGKEDPLTGLKENVIIGKLIPAGTGMKQYRDTKLNTDARIAEKPVGSADSISEPDSATDDEGG